MSFNACGATQPFPVAFEATQLTFCKRFAESNFQRVSFRDIPFTKVVRCICAPYRLLASVPLLFPFQQREANDLPSPHSAWLNLAGKASGIPLRGLYGGACADGPILRNAGSSTSR